MWYIIYYTFAIIIGIIWSIGVTVLGILKMILWPILFFELVPFWPLESEHVLLEYHSEHEEGLFPIFGERRPYKNKHSCYWRIDYNDYYHYIWGL